MSFAGKSFRSLNVIKMHSNILIFSSDSSYMDYLKYRMIYNILVTNNKLTYEIRESR